MDKRRQAVDQEAPAPDPAAESPTRTSAATDSPTVTTDPGAQRDPAKASVSARDEPTLF